jgi:hypothetical protein
MSVDDSQRACKHARMAVAKRNRGPTTLSHRQSAVAQGKEPLQVRIPVAVKRRFKSYAALKGMEPHELFVAVWEHYEASFKPETVNDGGTGKR